MVTMIYRMIPMKLIVHVHMTIIDVQAVDVFKIVADAMVEWLWLCRCLMKQFHYIPKWLVVKRQYNVVIKKVVPKSLHHCNYSHCSDNSDETDWHLSICNESTTISMWNLYFCVSNMFHVMVNKSCWCIWWN